MATTDPSDPDMIPPDMILAGELALGVLEGDELATAQRRLIAEPDFAAAVARWRDHFAAAALRGPAEPAPERIGARVMAAIAEPRGEAAIPLRRPSAARSPVALWRATALSLGAVAAVLAALVLRPPSPQPAPAAPVLVAAMTISADHTPPARPARGAVAARVGRAGGAGTARCASLGHRWPGAATLARGAASRRRGAGNPARTRLAAWPDAGNQHRTAGRGAGPAAHRPGGCHRNDRGYLSVRRATGRTGCNPRACAHCRGASRAASCDSRRRQRPYRRSAGRPTPQSGVRSGHGHAAG